MFRLMRSSSLVVAMLVSIVLAPRAAQANSTSRAFAEFGAIRFASDGGALRVGGFRRANLKPGAGLEVALHAWLVPAMVLTTDVGVSVPIEFGPNARLVPSAGLSVLGFAGGDYGLVTPGLHAGVGVLLGPDAPVAVRLGYLVRLLAEPDLRDEGVAHNLTIGLSWTHGGR